MADSTGQTQLPAPGSRATYDIGTLQNLHRQAKGARDRFIPDWYVNIAFYLGQQWLYWNRGRLDKPSVQSWRQMPVDNRILPVITARAARKVKNRPAFICTPFTADEDDIAAAQIGEKVLDADWDYLDLQQKLYQAILYAEICGAGFWKVYWDSTLGKSADFIINPNTGQPLTLDNGSPIKAEMLAEVPEGLQTQTISQGDVVIDVLSPFEIFPDPLATSLSEAEWIIEEKVRSVEYVRRRFGEDLPPDAGAPLGPVETRLATSMVWTSGESEEYKGIKVFEYWQKPSRDYPNGKRCVWAADKILLEDDSPADPMPYVMFEGIRSPNRFWPTSLVTQLRGPQTQLNKIRMQIAENGMRVGNPSLLRSRHANVQYTGIPGEDVLYDSTVPDAIPSFLEPPEMPVYVREQIQHLLDSISEISGMHDVSRATVPAGVTAASAINLLQEADDTRIGPEIQQMERAIAQAGTKTLKLRAQFNSDERLVRIAGEDGNWDIFGFRGQMLGQEPNVQVQAGSAMPRSKAAKQAAMTEILSMAFQYGVEFDPRDLRRFFKDFEVGGLDRLFDAISTSESQVQRENRQLSQGVPVEINDFDDDEVHIAGHVDFQRSARYQRLDSQAKAMVDLHVRAHREAMVQMTNQQMQVMSQEQQQRMGEEQQGQLEQTAMQQAGNAVANGGGGQ